MKAILFTVFIFTISGATAFAQTGEAELYEEYKKADKELNIVYNKFKSKLKKKEDKLALTNSQKAWLIFRTSNCKLISREESEGGVIANKIRIDCETQMTRERIKELESLMNEGFHYKQADNTGNK